MGGTSRSSSTHKACRFWQGVLDTAPKHNSCQTRWTQPVTRRAIAIRKVLRSFPPQHRELFAQTGSDLIQSRRISWSCLTSIWFRLGLCLLGAQVVAKLQLSISRSDLDNLERITARCYFLRQHATRKRVEQFQGFAVEIHPLFCAVNCHLIMICCVR